MERVPSKYINEIDPELLLYRLSRCSNEKGVEAAYAQFYAKVSDYLYVNPGIIPGTKAVDDGLVEFNHETQARKRFFYMQQECKFEKNPFGRDLYAQVSQALHYRYLYGEKYPIKGLIVNSEKFFGVLFYDEMEDIIADIDPKFRSLDSKITPSKSYDIVKYVLGSAYMESSVKIIDHNFMLHEEVKKIYQHGF